MRLHRTEGKDPGGSVTDAWSGRPSQHNILDWASICLLIYFFFSTSGMEGESLAWLTLASTSLVPIIHFDFSVLDLGWWVKNSFSS